MKGIARIYDHVTPEMRRQILDALEARWLGSLAAITDAERAEMVAWFPHLRTTLDDHQLGSATEDHRPFIAR